MIAFSCGAGLWLPLFQFDFAQGCAHRGDLRDHVNAVPVFVHHFGKTANLAFDAIEPRHEGLLLHIVQHAPPVSLNRVHIRPILRRIL